MNVNNSTDLQSVQDDIQALRQLLDEEFEALKRRELQALKSLEENKTDILLRLERHGPSFARAEDMSLAWVQARQDLRTCRDLHFKNLQLLRRQMDVVQGALQAMVGDSDPLPVIYDRLGKVGGGRLGRPWQSA